MDSELERNKEETSREITQREIRKTNIIAFNVPESKLDDPDNRKQHDRESLLQPCRELIMDDVEVRNFAVIVIVIFCVMKNLFQLQSITVRFISQTTY